MGAVSNDIPSDSLIGRMTAEAAKGREESAKPRAWRITDPTGTRTGRYSEPWWDVCDRAAAKYGSPPDPDEPLRYARALAMARADDRRKR